MKIAYDAKRFFHNTSGLGNYSRDLVRIMATFFPENSFLLLGSNDSAKGKEITELENVTFQKISGGKFARQLKMGKDAQNAGADIFHGLSGELPMKWNHTPIKKTVTIHDLIFERFPQYYSWFDRKIHFWKFKKAAESADLVIAISEQTKRDIVQFLKIPESKIRVVYQGCHAAFRKGFSQDELDGIREKYSLPERFVLNVGTIEERKNLLNVLKALKDTGIPLVVVGRKQKKYFSRIKKFMKRNSVEVQFLEGVSMEDLAGIYRIADVFVYPSFFEGFGIPVIEALFSETAVVTSNTSCLPEAGGPHSMYVNPRNPDDIKAKIVHLWENAAERQRRAEKGLEYVQKFNDVEIAQNLMEVYKDLIKKA